MHMTALNDTARVDESTLDARLTRIGGAIARYGLVLVIGWIGVQKFTAVEAHNVSHLVSNSPFMSWLYSFLSVTMFSDLLGVLEVTAAVLLAVKPWLPRVSAAGSVISIVLFLATISFLFSTPGVLDPAQGGFPWLSATGQFLLKDVTLLGASVWTLGDALRSARIGRHA
jgi:reactive chlorine resistance protein C